MKKYDVVILTESRYVKPEIIDDYVQNVLTEDGLIYDELKKLGLEVTRKDWDDKEFNWENAKILLIRSTWDYFHRFREFKEWINKVKLKSTLINSYEQINWNFDKHYLKDLQQNNINIPASIFIKKGSTKTLQEHMKNNNWDCIVIKPTISGAGRHTYKVDNSNVSDINKNFLKLIQEEDYIVQEFQKNIISKGEVAVVLINGEYTHAILKLAKKGDFRVQDDFGGTVHDYEPNKDMINFAQESIKNLNPTPVYARVDIIWDNNDKMAVSELELIEPELWFRNNPSAAVKIAKVLKEKVVI
jgi:glutathione synthase/RimK-type ligase-like ATP-grasp enzyme